MRNGVFARDLRRHRLRRRDAGRCHFPPVNRFGSERPRRVHAAGRRTPRRQLEEASAVHPRRARGARASRSRQHPDVGRAARVHVVHPRRLLRPEPRQVQRRHDRRRRAPQGGGPVPRSSRSAATRARRRRGRPRRRTAARDRDRRGITPTPLANVDGLIRQTRQPQFVSSAYFLRFKFDEGQYALVGREQFEGRDVLRVEYYPTRLYPKAGRGSGRAGPAEPARRRSEQQTGPPGGRVPARHEQGRARHAVDRAASHQIVKYTFDNIDFDFLPASGWCTWTLPRRR